MECHHLTVFLILLNLLLKLFFNPHYLYMSASICNALFVLNLSFFFFHLKIRKNFTTWSFLKVLSFLVHFVCLDFLSAIKARFDSLFVIFLSSSLFTLHPLGNYSPNLLGKESTQICYFCTSISLPT